MSLPQIARRYARALYEVADDAGGLPEVERDMVTLAGLLSALPEVLAWCQAGHAHASSATSFVRTAFLPHVGRLTGSTLLLAAEHDRLAALPLLPAAFEAASDARGDKIRVTLETAQSPDPDLVAVVERSLSARTGKTAVVKTFVDADLVAGFRVFWNDRLLDRSARGRLRALRSRLTSDEAQP